MRNFGTATQKLVDTSTLEYSPPGAVDVDEWIYLLFSYKDAAGNANARAITPPSGFTADHRYRAAGVANARGMVVLKKKVTDAVAEVAAADYVVTIAGTHSVAGLIFTSHSDLTDPYDGLDGSTNATLGSGSTITCPSITTTQDDAEVIIFVIQDRAGTFTMPATATGGAAVTEIGQQEGGDPADNINSVKIAAGHFNLPTAGATGSVAVSVNQSRDYQGMLFQLVPAAAASDTTAPTYSVNPATSSVTETGMTVTATASDETEPDYNFYVAVVADGVAKPSDSQIIAGTGGGILFAGSDLDVTNAAEASVALTGMTIGTNYDVYTLVSDGTNHDSSFAKIDQATLSAFVFTTQPSNIFGFTNDPDVLLDVNTLLPGVSSSVLTGAVPQDCAFDGDTNLLTYVGTNKLPSYAAGFTITAYEEAGQGGRSVTSDPFSIDISYPWAATVEQNGLHRTWAGSPLRKFGNIVGAEGGSFWVDPDTLPAGISSVYPVDPWGGYVVVESPESTPDGTYNIPMLYFQQSLVDTPIAFNYTILIGSLNGSAPFELEDGWARTVVTSLAVDRSVFSAPYFETNHIEYEHLNNTRTFSSTGVVSSTGTLPQTGLVRIWSDGELSDEESYTQAAVDTTPDQWTFSDITDAALNAPSQVSNIVTISGIDDTVNVSFSGHTSGAWSKNGDPYVLITTQNTTPVVSGDTLQLQLTAADTSSTARSVNMSSGVITDQFTVTTIAAVTNNPPTVANPIPDQQLTNGTAFSYSIPLGTFADLDAMTITAQVSGGAALSSIGLTLTGRAFSGTLANDTTATIEVIATDTANQTVSDYFTVTMVAIDVTPDSVVLTSVTDALINTQYQATAAVTGMVTGQPLIAEGVEVSNDGVNWFSSVTSSATTQVRATVTTGNQPDTQYTTNGTMNGASVSFTATTATQYVRSGRHMVDTGL